MQRALSLSIGQASRKTQMRVVFKGIPLFGGFKGNPKENHIESQEGQQASATSGEKWAG